VVLLKMMVPLKYRSKMDMLIRKGFPLIEVTGKGSEVVISAIFKKQINAFTLGHCRVTVF
jgi:hypothetical protein